MNGIANCNRVAFDTNIFIYQLEANPAFLPKTDRLFSALVQGRIQVVTSIITLTEILAFSISERLLNETKEKLLHIPNTTIYEVNQEIAEEAARLKRIFHVNLGDAIQLATATYAKADVFITNDDRLPSNLDQRVIQLKDLEI